MNIEKTISEHAVSDILTPMLESQDRIVTEDVAPLFDAATGLDTPPASGTVTTTIEESRSVITAIIRKAWTATLTMLGGASVISYIAAAYTYLRNRLQGNETYGIPDRRSEISASSPLAANLALLNDRKISGADTIDGVSLGRLLCDPTMAATVTEIIDDNDSWDSATAAAVNRLLTIFTNLKKLKLKFRTYSGYWTPLFSSEVPFTHAELYELTSTTDGIFTNAPYLTNNPFRDLETVSVSYAGTNATILGFTKIPVVDLGKLKTVRVGAYQSLIRGGEVREIYARALTSTTSNYNGYSAYSAGFIGNSMPNLEKVVLGTLTGIGYITCNSADALDAPNLLHVEFGEGTSCSINLDTWSPTITDDNKEQFLSNFKEFIAKRLQGGYAIGQGPTLTLSKAVRNAIHAAESTYGIENIIITQKGWTISPAPN
jgi:hypothetical protein